LPPPVSTPPPAIPVTTKKTPAPANGINLSGTFETWNVPPSQSIDVANVQFTGLTAQQLKQVLQRIPSAFKATLEITYQDGREQ
jgi:hypothetical protein